MRGCVEAAGEFRELHVVPGPQPALLIMAGSILPELHIAWPEDGVWREQPLQYPLGRTLGIGRGVLALGHESTDSRAAKPPFEREAYINGTTYLLAILADDGTSATPLGVAVLLTYVSSSGWYVNWTSFGTSIAPLSHSSIRMNGNGIDSLEVMGDTFRIDDAKSRIFSESNPGPHRVFHQTWMLDPRSPGYVLESLTVEPSSYNTLVEFVYRLSIGDDSGADALAIAPALPQRAKDLGFVQTPLGQAWVTDYGSDRCCNPTTIKSGPAKGVRVSFVHRGSDWLISAIDVP